MGGKDRLQSFVSLGMVEARPPYQADMGNGFVPFRRDVRYVAAEPAPIAPLLDELDFVDDRRHWGQKFRYGLFEGVGEGHGADCTRDARRAAGVGACACRDDHTIDAHLFREPP